MKKGIHAEYKQTTITCACGNVINIGSTKENLKIDVCSVCHPFYTGVKSKMIDKGGRIERFRKKYKNKAQ